LSATITASESRPGIEVVERCGNSGEVKIPFRALGGDQIWVRFTEDLKLSTTRDTTRHVRPAVGLLRLLEDETSREDLRALLVQTCFPPFEQAAVATAIQLSSYEPGDAHALCEQVRAYVAGVDRGRDVRLRIEVIARYQFTCALTGYRLTTEEGNLVEAAHIDPWSRSRDDDPRNGLALTRDAHWMFDRGLWSGACNNEDDSRVVARAGAFAQAGPLDGFRRGNYADRNLAFDTRSRLRPSTDRLRQHHRRFFSDSRSSRLDLSSG
jgi:putative restriction endonuclease